MNITMDANTVEAVKILAGAAVSIVLLMGFFGNPFSRSK